MVRDNAQKKKFELFSEMEIYGFFLKENWRVNFLYNEIISNNTIFECIMYYVQYAGRESKVIQVQEDIKDDMMS